MWEKERERDERAYVHINPTRWRPRRLPGQLTEDQRARPCWAFGPGWAWAFLELAHYSKSIFQSFRFLLERERKKQSCNNGVFINSILSNTPSPLFSPPPQIPLFIHNPLFLPPKTLPLAAPNPFPSAAASRSLPRRSSRPQALRIGSSARFIGTRIRVS